MKIKEIMDVLELLAPPSLQEDYDNSGLLIGDKNNNCIGALICLDVTEKVVEEAKARKCNLIISHHPLIFRGVKKITSDNYVSRTIINTIKNDIAVYAIHTNLDNVSHGVNSKIAEKLELKNCTVLLPKADQLKKLVTFSPVANSENVRNALFTAGAGAIGKYSECSYNVSGEGTFKAGEGTNPFVGKKGERHTELEIRIEVIFPQYIQETLLTALKQAHPYEEVAYYIQPLDNLDEFTGSGMVGDLDESISPGALMEKLKHQFNLSVIRHTDSPVERIKRIAVCGGSGFFLLPNAITSGAQAYITSDIKYHDFFEAEGEILLADIGHFESEQFTTDLLSEILSKKYPNFAVLKSETRTNPVRYFT